MCDAKDVDEQFGLDGAGSADSMLFSSAGNLRTPGSIQRVGANVRSFRGGTSGSLEKQKED